MLNAPHNKRCEKAREKWKNDCLNLIECSTSDKDKEREKFFKQKVILLLCMYDYENFSDENVEHLLTKKIT